MPSRFSSPALSLVSPGAVQRVVVETDEGRKSFLVHRSVRDEFISERVKELFGRRADGAEYDWEAFDVEEAVKVEVK